MDYEPNVDAVIWFCREIWPGIRYLHPKARFFIVGRDPTADVLALGQLPGVTITGTVADTRPFYDQSKVYIAPIRFGSGTRLKILEAMAMKVPIVATNFSVEGLDLTPGRDYLSADAPDSFVEKISSLLSDPLAGERISSQARRTVDDRYNWMAIVKTLEGAYNYAIERNQINKHHADSV
jgi:glycosyltransferase involved in cell wall biosynthesis